MMGFSMPYLKKNRRNFLAVLVTGCRVRNALLVMRPVHAQGVTTLITGMRLDRTEDGLSLSAQVKFELPPVVEDALLKGIPMFFVAEAEVTRDRWYWYDKKIAVNARVMRLSFQPLTRRWRLNVTNGTLANAASGVSLPQYFDSIGDALAKIQRISNWKIAELSEVEQDSAHNVELHFKLDVSQLPRPFQIGLIGNSDWTISAVKSVRLVTEGGK